MNNLLTEVLQWMQNNNYRRASFDRIVGIVPSAATYEQLNKLIDDHPDIFRTARIKGGLEGLAVLDEVDVAITLDHLREEAEVPLTAQAVDPNTAPRVTEVDIESEIVNEYYRNLGGAVKASENSSLHNTTICALELRNGFTIVGKSACVYPELYDEDKGRELARKDAIRQVWPLLGFRLADKRVSA